uniref:Cysteine-rich receptor-like protein kinase n=1 Tax=Tanacetum cinerariifolium TaxID=118510 RepID=A0A6L2N522_TANCI|nr:cysteine-rich receptor-like protein kinase [Tanacetum cinerariifolium]
MGGGTQWQWRLVVDEDGGDDWDRGGYPFERRLDGRRNIVAAAENHALCRFSNCTSGMSLLSSSLFYFSANSFSSARNPFVPTLRTEKVKHNSLVPISLIGSLYKIIAKILANRLVTVLDDIVDEIQSAFVTDRQILDGHFILNEIVHWCKNKKKQSMIFKVDFEKAYDSVRWDFIDVILRRFGFGEK